MPHKSTVSNDHYAQVSPPNPVNRTNKDCKSFEPDQGVLNQTKEFCDMSYSRSFMVTNLLIMQVAEIFLHYVAPREILMVWVHTGNPCYKQTTYPAIVKPVIVKDSPSEGVFLFKGTEASLCAVKYPLQ